MARVLVLMLRDRGANFRGEKVYYDEDKVQQMIAERACVRLDENGEPILTEDGVVDVVGAGGDGAGDNNGNDGAGDGQGQSGSVGAGGDGAGNSIAGSGNVGGGNLGGDGRQSRSRSRSRVRSNEQPNPIEIDGIDAKVIAALAEVGVTNPEQLRAYVAGGKKLADLPAVGETGEKELLDLYSEVAE